MLIIKKHIEINGMSCEHCVRAVTSVLEILGGKNIMVNLSEGYADADFNAEIKNENIISNIEEEGYTVTNIKDI